MKRVCFNKFCFLCMRTAHPGQLNPKTKGLQEAFPHSCVPGLP